MGQTYNFPCKREDIERCNDKKTLESWQHEFELVLSQMESDYGGIDNVPERLYKYAKANDLNLKQIKFKLRKLTSPVTSAGALKAFHDTVQRLMPNEYGHIVNQTLKSLGKEGANWNELIKYRKR